jgi:uncharacterized protein (DUF433 family)
MWFFHHFARRSLLFFAEDELNGFLDDPPRVSFRRLTDLYVRAFAVQTLGEWSRTVPRQRDRRESFQEAAWRAIDCYRADPLFFGERPAHEGIARLLESCTAGLGEAERVALQKRLLLCLDRFEMKADEPMTLYPFSRVPAEGSPRTVVMDPRVRFGRPTIAGCGVPTDILFERHQAGDSLTELAQDYDISATEVEEAVRYEAMPGALLFPIPGW